MMTKTQRKSIIHPAGITGFLYRHAWLAFFLFFLLALWAFGSSYYGVLGADHPWHIHLHGISMTLWCILLIGQGLLIRFRKYKVHHLMGRLSYVLVPFIIISGVQLAHHTISQVPAGTPVSYYLAALMFNSLIVFAILYGLAMFFRKTPATHARYMFCTILPLVTPVTDRIIYKNFRELTAYVPAIEGMPVVPTIGFMLVNLLVLALLIWDWRAHKRLDVFPLVLALLVLYHVSVLKFYQYGFWQSVTDWVMRFNLS